MQNVATINSLAKILDFPICTRQRRKTVFHKLCKNYGSERNFYMQQNYGTLKTTHFMPYAKFCYDQ